MGGIWKSGSCRSVEKESFWRLVVDGQKASGLSVRVFCKRESVSEPSFYAWQKELAKRDQGRTASESSQLIPVSVVNQNSGNEQLAFSSRSSLNPSGTLEVETPDGFKLRFDHRLDALRLRDLLQVVACCGGHNVGVVGGSSC